LRMTELEKKVIVFEQGARVKEAAIAQLMAENIKLKAKEYGHSDNFNEATKDIDVSGLDVRIDDNQINEERLEPEAKEKEEQRYHVTQFNEQLQEKLRVSQCTVSDLKQQYSQAAEELARVKDILAMRPNDCEIPEDVDPGVLVAQLRERIKMLETQNRQISDHSREQSGQMQLLRQDKEAIEVSVYH